MTRSKRVLPASPLEARAGEALDPWQSTQAQTALATQLFPSEDDYLADPQRDVGRQTGVDQHELFVSCDPAEALQQQFAHWRPHFIAVHDIATTSSRKLLAGVAAATGRKVQKLSIRRQGFGTALATLEFVELATADGGSLRMYCTDAEADAASRNGLARMLLAFSRLGVVMVGDLAAHAIPAALKPLHEAMVVGPWPNRHLVLLPLASAGAWVTHGIDLTHGTGVSVRTTPQVARPADAWGFITGSWARLRDGDPSGAIPALAQGRAMSGAARAAQLTPATASSVPAPINVAPARVPEPAARAGAELTRLAMRPMPAVRSATHRAAAEGDVLERYVHQLAELTGMVSCCVFDVAARRALAHAGATPAADHLAWHGAELLNAMSASSRTLGLGHAQPDAALTLGGHHLLLRAVPRHPGLALHAVLDKTQANLVLVRLQVMRMDSLFDEALGH